MSCRIETVWRLIPLHNQSRNEVNQFARHISQFCRVDYYYYNPLLHGIPLGQLLTAREQDIWKITTPSPEDEGMIRLYCGANYDLEMLSQTYCIQCN